ncbi:MAG: 50S ribosomal protein L29 [Proteobacteria bacterium]|nr:50S ribosomal protein L29 [Pseudomonadota bacterium]
MAEKKTVKKETKTTAKAPKAVHSALSRDALQSKLTDLKKEAMNLRFQHAAGQLPKSHVIRKNRREIARVKTALGASN